LRRDFHDGGFDGFENLQVSGAAAQIAGESVANLLAIGMRILVEQSFRGDENCRGAVSALRGAEVGERFLQRVESAIDAHALDGEDIPLIAFEREDETGKHGLAVEKDGAGAAFAEFAAVLGAGVPEIFSKNFEQGFVRGEGDVSLFAVQRDSNV
jgi:hypothetical protein